MLDQIIYLMVTNMFKNVKLDAAWTNKEIWVCYPCPEESSYFVGIFDINKKFYNYKHV